MTATLPAVRKMKMNRKPHMIFFRMFSAKWTIKLNPSGTAMVVIFCFIINAVFVQNFLEFHFFVLHMKVFSFCFQKQGISGVS
jgi:hypothetical protein